MPRYAFEDFPVGLTIDCGSKTVDRDEVIVFAREFDPQPFHLDEEAAKASLLGGLSASGWHSCAMTMRLLNEGFVLDSTSMGGPGVEEVKWLLPVKPGDTLSVRTTVLQANPSRSKPDRGMVQFRTDVTNQTGAVALRQINWILFKRREDGEAAAASPEKSNGEEAPSRGHAPSTNSLVAAFEDIEIGARAGIGSYTFTPERIIAYAEKYDPQSFHLSEEGGRKSHFGGLIASGWHTAAVWMRLMIEERKRQLQDLPPGGGNNVDRFGPSPGFRDLFWRKPVYAGDTLTYQIEVVDKRPSLSKPEWGLVFHHNTARNQRGELVFEFTGTGFWRRRPLA